MTLLKKPQQILEMSDDFRSVVLNNDTSLMKNQSTPNLVPYMDIKDFRAEHSPEFRKNSDFSPQMRAHGSSFNFFKKG